MENIWITNVKHAGGHKLNLTFSDGVTGTVNLADHLDKLIFQPLQNEDEFSRFRLGSWTVEWDNGADFAPEFLHSLIGMPERAR